MTGTQHPLDPATAAEYLAGREILAAAGLLTDPVRFAYYGLEEPSKYEVLAGAFQRGEAADRRLADNWDAFVVPGLGVRCVSDQPWVTVAETCELVLALDACGQQERAREVFATIGRLRHDDGSYWTGWQYANEAHFPAERSSWTSAAAVLAADALSGFSAGAAIFRAVPAPFGARPPADPVACGCASSADALTGAG